LCCRLDLVLVLALEVGLIVLLFGCVVWHWLRFVFYEQREGERRRHERRRERLRHRGPPWSDPRV
jgi:hypothetical protein